MESRAAVKIVSIEEQQSELKDTNIPIVERNLHTGWPLLQISLFRPFSQEAEFPVVCHLQQIKGAPHPFHIAGGFFTKLLTKIKGAEIKSFEDSKLIDPDEFIKRIIEGSNFRYKLVHKTLDVRVVEEPNNKLGIKLPSGTGDAEAFAKKLENLTHGNVSSTRATLKPKPFFIRRDKKEFELVKLGNNSLIINVHYVNKAGEHYLS